MSLKITKQDKKRVINTAIVFTVIFAICAGLAGLFLGITPRTEDTIAIGVNNEQILSLVESHDGETYFAASDNWFVEYDSFTGEKIGEDFNVTESVKQKIADDGKTETVANNSLKKWSIHAKTVGEDEVFVLYDTNGNIFQIKKNESGKFAVLDDYFLIAKDENGKYSPREIKGIDFVEDEMFVLLKENNFFYVSKYDLNDISKDYTKRKLLWELGFENDGYYQIEPTKASTGILSFSAHENFILVVKSGGGIIKLSTELVDTNYGGENIDFFEDVKKHAQRTEEEQILYDELYDESYLEFVKVELKKWRQTWIDAKKIFKRNENDDESITEEEIDAITSIDEIWGIFDVNNLTLATNQIKTNAKAHATKVADEAYPVGAEWFKDYDEATGKMSVKEEYIVKECYSTYIPGGPSISGMIYSKKNRALYYTNASDGYLYVAEIDDLSNSQAGSSIGDSSKKIENIKCEKGQSFSNFGNGLGYNRFANSLYLKYENERNVTIVDISDKQNYFIQSEYVGTFDMYSLTGDKDNKVTHVMHQVVKVDNKGIDHNYRYICTYEPERFENKSLISLIFVVFLAIGIITFFIALWLWISSMTDKGVGKVKFVVKDTKKNKFVYLVLFFFVGMLIMFCYYEAVGAITMSFFDYTKEKPAWIWNDFANYIKIFNDSNFLPSIINMLIFLVADVFLSIVPPIIFAILLILIRNKTTSNVVRSLMFIPGIIPSIASMLIWRVGIYGDEGILNQIIVATGGETINWLLNKDFAIWSLIFMGFPFIGGYLIFYGGMMNVPKEYHEAGKLEGLGIIKRFLTIDIPLIKPQIKYIFITTFIASVQNFARTHVLRSTVVKTPVQSMYEMMTLQGDYGMSSAYATLIFIFLFAAIATNFKMQKQDAMGADL